MAGGGGSTGGIGAQSPAVNPPNPMGQIGSAVGGALGGGAQQTTPAYGPSTIQTGQFGSQPIPMGNNLAYNSQPQGPMGGMLPDYANSFPAPPSFGQPPMDPRMMGGEGFTPGFGQQLMSPENMAMMQQAAQAARQGQGQGQMGLGQAAQTGALTQPQTAGLGGLAALLGGSPTPPTPAVSAPPPPPPPPPPAAPVAAKPAPVAAKRAPVAAKPVAKPFAVPPKTPPAVASAIQKLAAKKNFFRRR